MLKYKKKCLVVGYEDTGCDLPILNNPNCKFRMEKSYLHANGDSNNNIKSFDNLSDLDTNSVCSEITVDDKQQNRTTGANFHYASNFIRTYLLTKKFIECCCSSDIGIIGHFNNPSIIALTGNNIKTYSNILPLECEFLKNKKCSGVFTLTNCYHDIKKENNIYTPHLEIIMKGDMYNLDKMLCELISSMGFKNVRGGNYHELLNKYGLQDINPENYSLISGGEGDVFFIKNIPVEPNKRWYVNKTNTNFNTIYVLINGLLVIEAFEHNCNTGYMRETFYDKTNNKCRNVLSKLFDKSTVDTQFDMFLENRFTVRSGITINVFNLIKCMICNNLMPGKYL
uniref:Uncharacterized protein n=1 Tax=viral metagenome TaxID=1070528 RepID=A0A6C0LLS0_9ZZZZ